MKKKLFWLVVLGLSIFVYCYASTAASRQYDFTDDRDAGIPITASRMDAEFDNIITKLNQKVQIKATAPDSPIAGQLWYDSTNKLLKEYRNSEWVIHAPVHVATANMTTAQDGDLLYNTSIDTLQSYNGSAWKTYGVGTITGPATNTNAYVPVWNGTNTVMLSAGHPVVSGTSSGASLLITDASGYLPDFSIDTTALKTATGEVTATGQENLLILPGGSYGFYPQVKGSASETAFGYQILGSHLGGGAPNTTYITTATIDAVSTGTAYIQQRYITASGEDLWIFLLVDKVTKEIISAYQAPDHPAYGNGGDFDKVPHPFSSYDATNQEIVLVDKETCQSIKSESEQSGESILTLINEHYKPDMNEVKEYVPLHSGRFINASPEKVKSIPVNIKVRGLSKLTNEEKENRRLIKETQKLANTKKKKEMEQNKIKVKNKLIEALNLTEDEIGVLIK